MPSQHIRRAVLLACGGGLAFGAPVQAQQLEEIIVTATKRAESIQDVGASISALSSEELQDFGMNNAWDLSQHTPNMTITAYFAQSRPEITIRGVGQNNTFGSIDQSPTGVYNDEVYVGARAAQLTQMFDLERVEVLRGPQGTLYGRNTTGGAINFISRKPSFEGSNVSGAATVGKYGQVEGELAGGAALSETVAFRAAGIYRHSDGYTKNLFDGKKMSGLDGWAGRFQLAVKPSDAVNLLFNVHGSDLDSDSPAIHFIGFGNDEPDQFTPIFSGQPGYQETGDFHTLSNNRPGFEKNKVFGGSARADIDLGGVTSTSIFAYDSVDTRIREDSDGTPVDFFTIDYDDDVKSWSLEQRFAGKIDDGALAGLDWVFGAYLYKDKVVTANQLRLFPDPVFDVVFGPGGLVGLSNYTQKTTSWAVFGDIQYKFTDSLQLNAGLRYSKDRKKFDWLLADNFGTSSPYQETRSWDAVTGRIGLDWNVTDRVMLYGGYSRGFKSGGFNGVALNPPLPAAEDISFDPEYADSFEAGVKSEWLGGRLVVNAAVFHMILKNQQTLIVQPGNIFTVQNAAKSKVDGAELDIRLQATDALFMQASLGLLDARYSKFTENRTFPTPVNLDFKGNPLPAAPDVTFSGLVEYRVPAWNGSHVTPRFEWSYTDDQNYDRYGKNRRDSLSGALIPSGVDIQKAYWLLNAALSWDSADDHYSVMAWVHNLTDKGYYVKKIGNFADSFNGGGAVAYPGSPRMFGVTVRFNFE